MSSTLTWAYSGLATKTGTAIANLIDDLDTLVTSKAGDATFFWQTAAKQTAVSPHWIVLKRKDASAGRILLVHYGSAPAAYNAAIFSANGTTGTLYCTWFPNGNVDSPSNLTAASGTIMGVDTDALYVGVQMALTSIYAASVQVFYMDSEEGMYFGFNNPGNATQYGSGAGKLVIDAADAVYDCMISTGTVNHSNIVTATALWPWLPPSNTLAPSGTATHIRANYGGANKAFFQAWNPQPWASQSGGSDDPLADTGTSKAWFVPVQLCGQTKGGGFLLKLRQIGFGPKTTGPAAVYNGTGPVVKARQFCSVTAGGNFPWFTNFKI